jgi:protease PrsW
MNTIHLRYLVIGFVVLLIAREAYRDGLLVGLLPLAAPLAWLMLFVLWRRQPEPTSYMAIALALCCGWLFAPLYVLGESLNDFFAYISGGSPLFYFVLRAGLVEELIKFFAVLVVLKWLLPEAVKHPLDGVVLACAAALGFATYENAYHNLYLFSLDSGALQAFLLGALVRVPLHPLFSSLWGAALGLAVCMPVAQRYITIISGLAAAMFLHGLWDTMAQSQNGIIFACMVLLYGLIWFGYARLRRKLAAILVIPAPSLF